jgi:hypothetical protein
MGNNHKIAGLQALEDPVIASHAAVAKARNVLDDLVSQQAALVSNELSLRDEKKKIGYDSFARRDEKSRARLTEITHQHFTLQSELTSLEGAIEEARQRLAASQTAERLEVQKAKARDILVRLEGLDSAAQGCDLALKAFMKSYAEMQAHLAAIRGATNRPDPEIVRVLSVKALQTHCLPWIRIFNLGHLAPGERVTFQDLAGGWGGITSGWCRQRLGSPELDVELPIDDAAE